MTNTTTPMTEQEYRAQKQVIKSLQKKDGPALTVYKPVMDEVKIPDRIEAQRRALENKALEQDILLKKRTLTLLFRFLAAETVAVFVFAFLQAVGAFGFALDEWSFKLLVGATIAQITVMLMVAVRHLFPESYKGVRK